jgi:hypothetical protein
VRFQKLGDQGAIVFDLQGRVVWMLHGVERLGNVRNVTHIAPIEWLFSNTEKTLGAFISINQIRFAQETQI